MVTIGRIIKVVDAICDCLPGVSTLTNGIQLLYKRTRKVDTACNPNGASLADKIKIHLINKTKFDCLMGLLPFFGNFVNAIYYVKFGLTRELTTAVVTNNIEVVKLYLANYPLQNDKKAEKILSQAAFSSNVELFNLILNSRQWNSQAIVNALNSVWFNPETREEEIANKLLDYGCDIHGTDLTRVITAFRNAGKIETAQRIERLTQRHP